MTILHIGQLGIGLWAHTPPAGRERRVEMLAQHSSQRGHKVTILATAPYISSRLTHAFGIAVVRRLSLNPQQPGGWVYLLMCLWTLWRQQPHVVHLHGWRAGALAWLAALVSPESTIMWTTDSIGAGKRVVQRLIALQAQRVCDAITSPSRTVQYLLYHFYGVRSRYIPDGYAPATIPSLPPTQFGVRAGQYYVILGNSDAALARVSKLYKKIRSQKKLAMAVPQHEKVATQLGRERRIVLTENFYGRRLQSLLQHATAVVIADGSVPTETLLSAMAYGRLILAPNEARYQEILGVAGRYYRPTRPQELLDLWQASLKKGSPRQLLGRQAHTRATHHFTWDRVTSEYLTAYAGQRHAVAIDSLLVPATQNQLSVARK